MAVLGLLSLCYFADVLFAPGDTVASFGSADAAQYFAPMRAFCAGEVLRGNLPLWNPHLFSGTPCLGNFQSALFYPPNVLYLILPLHRALNLDMALHLFLVGAFMYAWGRGRGLRPLAACFAGGVLMFSEPFALSIFAGHLTMLSALAWAPLVFWAVDRMFDGPCLRWWCVGVLAVTMQVFAGLPQMVFCTGIAVGFYCLLRLFPATDRVRVIVPLLSLAAVPLLLGAVQLWPGIQTGWESTRDGGLPYPFATNDSLPPEKLMCLLVPGLFGDFLHSPYCGRGSFLEVSLFIGITAMLLAGYGARRGSKTVVLPLLAMVFLFVIVSLGKYTPLYWLMYEAIPGLDRFRIPARFGFFAAMPALLLAGMGIDSLLEGRERKYWPAAVAAGTGLFLGLAALWMFREAALPSGTGLWARFLNALAATGEVFLDAPPPYPETARYAFKGLCAAGLTCLALAALLWLARTSRQATVLIVVLGIAEVFSLARSSRCEFSLSKTVDPEIAAWVRQLPKDCRIVDGAMNSNRIMAVGGDNLWGYDPVLLKRYAMFVSFTQGEHRIILGGGDNPSFRVFHPLFQMLRCRYALQSNGVRQEPITAPPPLPRFLFLHDFRVERDVVSAFMALGAPDFDPRRTVVLETAPVPPPEPGGTDGQVAVVSETTDSMVLDISVPAPTILLITDAYARGWRARPVQAGPQQQYEVLPANAIVRAIPLAAGQHHLILEYAPSGFLIGKWVSLVAWTLFLGVAVLAIPRRRPAPA